MKNLTTTSYILMLLISFLSIDNLQAQSQGSIIGNAGIVLRKDLTPIGASIEYFLSNAISVGSRTMYVSKSGVTAYSINGMGNYHLARILAIVNDKIDPYAGVNIGKAFATASGVGTFSSSIYLDAQLGFRYFATNSIGIYTAVNFGLIKDSGSNFEIGLTYRFR